MRCIRVVVRKDLPPLHKVIQLPLDRAHHCRQHDQVVPPGEQDDRSAAQMRRVVDEALLEAPIHVSHAGGHVEPAVVARPPLERLDSASVWAACRDRCSLYGGGEGEEVLERDGGTGGLPRDGHRALQDGHRIERAAAGRSYRWGRKSSHRPVVRSASSTSWAGCDFFGKYALRSYLPVRAYPVFCIF